MLGLVKRFLSFTLFVSNLLENFHLFLPLMVNILAGELTDPRLKQVRVRIELLCNQKIIKYTLFAPERPRIMNALLELKSPLIPSLQLENFINILGVIIDCRFTLEKGDWRVSSGVWRWSDRAVGSLAVLCLHSEPTRIGRR